MLLLSGRFYWDFKQSIIVYIQIFKEFRDLSMSEHPSCFIQCFLVWIQTLFCKSVLLLQRDVAQFFKASSFHLPEQKKMGVITPLWRGTNQCWTPEVQL